MPKHLPVLLLLLFSRLFTAQTYVLSGKVTGNNEPLPFASVYLKGTSIGVNSNDEGSYALKLPAGKHTVVFQYVGYSKQEMLVDIQGNKTLDVSLKADGVALKEVVINAGEDPAYPIMRKAIKKRKDYVDPLAEYSCQSYIKGLQRLIYIPEKFKKLLKATTGEKIDSTDLGVIYLSESESNYYYRRPGKHKEVMFSSRVSGSSKSFSYNQLGQLSFNFYESMISLYGLSPRPFVSPLHGNAFFYYRFYLLGTITEDGKTYNKIKVKPKRANDPCFTGTIYIQDDSWRLTGLDLKLTKDNKINYVDTLTIKQLFAPVSGDSVWMPVNYNISYYFNFLGIAANGYANAIVKNYNVQPKLKEDFFTSEVLVIEDGANKKDSAYWNQNRMAPLSREENIDYHKKDSSEKIENTDRYKDSVDHITNRYRLSSALMGHTYRITKKGIEIGIPGIITNGVQYNTVEGLNLSYKFNAERTYEDFRQRRLEGRVRYGFSNKLWGGELGYTYLYNPKKFSRFSISAKSIVEQFNPAEPINQLVNSLYTLFMNENHMKLYKETAVEAKYFTELLNGFYLSSTVKYAQREALHNSTDLLLRDDPDKHFTSNNPLNIYSDAPLFATNNALIAELAFAFRFKQKYVTMPGRKVLIGSKYPRLNVSYTKAIPALGATIDYDLVKANVSDAVLLGLFGRFRYSASGGYFLTSKNMTFVDYRHFNGNQTLFVTGDYLSTFRLLPYYTYSTNKWFLDAHGEHHFNGFIFNKLPLLKKLKAQEVVGLHWLMNDKINQYYEINFGVENIFRIIRVDYVLGYGLEGKVRSGLTIGILTRF